MKKQKKSKNKKPLSKGALVAIISSCVGLSCLGCGVGIGYIVSQNVMINNSQTLSEDLSINDVKYSSTNIVEPVSSEGFEYIGSTEVQQNENGSQYQIHTFVLGKVNNVPFYNSAKIQFSYNNIDLKLSYKDITSQTISDKLSQSRTKTESSTWSASTSFQSSTQVGIESKFPGATLKATQTITFGVNASLGGTNLNSYTASEEQTKTSVESFEKTSDYTFHLNENNGFKLNKFYRISLRQSSSYYLVIYEDKSEGLSSKETYTYDIVNYLDNPSDYSLVIEESDDINEEPTSNSKFKDSLIDDCIQYIKDNPVQTPSESREQRLNRIFGSKPIITSDTYTRKKELTITDAEKEDNPHDIIPFSTLFSSKLGVTKSELLDFGYTKFKVEMNIEAKRCKYHEGWHHIYIVRSINEYSSSQSILWHNKDINDNKSWTNWFFTADDLKLSDIGDENLTIFYEGSGNGCDEWYNRNLSLKITIS